MENYDFFDLTGLPFDPPEKSAKKINATIDKKVKELESVLSHEIQPLKRDEITNQIKLLNDTRAAILEPNGQSTLNALSESKVNMELKKLLSIIGLMIEADIWVLSESAIKHHHKKSGLSCKRIRDEFESSGFVIRPEKVFDIRELFPKNIRFPYDNLVSLNKLLQSDPRNPNAMFVDSLYSLIAYLMGAPENELIYKELSTEELRGMVTVLSKTLCSRCDSLGKIAASLVAYAKAYVFDSDEHRNAYDLSLRYSDTEFQSILLAMREAHVSVLLDKRFAEKCISHIKSFVGDYDTATAMYNSICMLKDTPYPLFAKTIDEEDEINNIKSKERNDIFITQTRNNKRYYGIDLGTTYSVISTLGDNGIPEIVVNQDEGSNLLASAVYFQEGGEPVVGEIAKDQKYIEPERVVEFVKRYIGKPDAPTYEFDGVTYDPITIASLILKRMKEYANYQGHDVKDVVITCPAYFGSEECAATKQAGLIAGLNVLNIVNEPTAAVLNYCCREFKGNRKIMVYDLGGGTFDITLFDYSIDENGKTFIDIIETDGNDRLGGIDWDARMYDYMCEQYEFENGISQYDMDIELQQIIKARAERAKKDLSTLQKKSYAISYDGNRTRIELTRKDYESRTRDLVEQTMFIVKQLLDRSGLSADDVDVVLLVGGSTRMPMIRNAVEAMFPGRVRFDDPDLAVAKGAALVAAIDSSALVFPPVTPPTPPDIIIDYWPKVPVLEKSIGIKVFSNGEMMVKNLLYKGTELPKEATFMLNTATDNQESFKIELYTNNSTDEEICMDVHNGDENTLASISRICEVSIALRPEMPALTPIELRLRYDGELAVSAVNLITGDTFETVVLLPDKEK